MLRLGNSGKTSRQSALMMRLMKLAGGVGATAMGGRASVPVDEMSAASFMACLLWNLRDERARAGSCGREPKPPLLDKPGFQYAVLCLEPPADVGGLFDSGRIVVERDRDRGIRVKAPLLRLRHLRTHEGRRLETVLMEPERPPE